MSLYIVKEKYPDKIKERLLEGEEEIVMKTKNDKIVIKEFGNKLMIYTSKGTVGITSVNSHLIEVFSIIDK